LIFQMPLDRINELMTMGSHWKENGFGESGETYLVGPDHTLRSQSRFQIEDPQAYYQALREANIDTKTVNTIQASGSGIGLQPVNSDSTEAALKGNSGILTVNDYRGIPVLSAYTPVKIEDVNWALLSEMDRSEALKDQQTLMESLLTKALVTTSTLLILACLAGWVVGSRLSRPIEEFSAHIQNMSLNRDLTLSYKARTNDELGVLSQALNTFTDELRQFFIRMTDASKTLTLTSDKLTRSANETRDFAGLQNQENDSVATAATELDASVDEVAKLTEASAQHTRETKQLCESSNASTIAVRQEMQELADRMQETTQTITNLETESRDIGDVLDVIQSIAEQTNLLALNAAIEAARAGEQGRGFAVVADEVRTLAARTAESTEEIRLKIETLQKGTDSAVRSVNESQTHTLSSIKTVELAVVSIHEMTEKIAKVDDMAVQIAAATEEQSQVTAEISRNVNKVKDMSQEIVNKTDETSDSSQELNKLASHILDDMQRFKC
jgi:methyl-accepting chemotaxis protein